MPSTPLSLAPLPPRITALGTSSSLLLCAGGQTVLVTGSGLGREGQDVVVLVVTNARNLSFTSPPCVVEVDSVQVGDVWVCSLLR